MLPDLILRSIREIFSKDTPVASFCEDKFEELIVLLLTPICLFLFFQVSPSLTTIYWGFRLVIMPLRSSYSFRSKMGKFINKNLEEKIFWKFCLILKKKKFTSKFSKCYKFYKNEKSSKDALNMDDLHLFPVACVLAD